MRLWLNWFGLVVIFFGPLLIPLDAHADDGPSLFHINRNKNTNEVHYHARVSDCRWDTDPVEAQWHDLEEGPRVRSKLRWFQQPAYGFHAQRVDAGRTTIRLKAKPEVEIFAQASVSAVGCSFDVSTTINSNPADLRFVYVCAKGWSVQYVDIHGFDQEGSPVVQRYSESRWARNLPLPQPIPDGELPPLGAPNCGY